MKIERLHEWYASTREAAEIQRRLAARVRAVAEPMAPRFIAGVDVSVARGRKTATAVVVVLTYPGLALVEVQTATGELDFPYVPGLLSFREAPLTLAACEKLALTPDLFLVDGHGYAHPRRMGIACHLGLWLDTPTIGCAKSLLIGSHETPGPDVGDWASIVDRDEVIGAALRTRQGVKPVYVSIGHRVDLPTAIEWVLKCCRGYRLPEPARFAHLASTGRLNGTIARAAVALSLSPER